jgi:hypothetical protein
MSDFIDWQGRQKKMMMKKTPTHVIAEGWREGERGRKNVL